MLVSCKRILLRFRSSVVLLSRPITSVARDFTLEGNRRLSDGAMGEHNFPKEEEKILELWKELDAFKSCLRQSKGKPRLVHCSESQFVLC